ncbi:MAG: hypothetical protein MRJ92_08780 [Nitrospira sp.]|nr:hypothetical protein [Nitrospira sp.]
MLVEGPADAQEMIRVGDRLVDIRYSGTKRRDHLFDPSGTIAPEGTVLYDHDDIAAQLIAKAAQRFRQGPPAAGIHERIRLKAECLHWLGKVEDLRDRPQQPNISCNCSLKNCVSAFFRLRGLWFTAPVDTLRSRLTTRHQKVAGGFWRRAHDATSPSVAALPTPVLPEIPSPRVVTKPPVSDRRIAVQLCRPKRCHQLSPDRRRHGLRRTGSTVIAYRHSPERMTYGTRIYRAGENGDEHGDAPAASRSAMATTATGRRHRWAEPYRMYQHRP